MHTLKAMPEEGGGRGKKGGLSEYARRLGKDKGNLSRYREAARVVIALNGCIDTTVLLDRAQHLAEFVKHTIRIGSLLDRAQHLAEVATADAVLWPLSELWQKSVSGRQNSDKPVDARKENTSAEFCGTGRDPDRRCRARGRGGILPPQKSGEATETYYP